MKKSEYNCFVIRLYFTLVFMLNLVIPIFIYNFFSPIIISCSIISALFALYTFVTNNSIIWISKIYILKSYLKVYFIFLLSLGLCFIINGILLASKGHVAMGIMFAIVIPVITLCFELIDTEKFTIHLCGAIKSIFIIFILISIFCGPRINSEAYKSFLSNPNYFALILNVSLVSLLVLSNIEKRIVWITINQFCICLIIIFLLLSRSRTSLLTSIVIFATFVAFKYYNAVLLNKRMICNKFVKKLLTFSIIFLLALSFVYLSFMKFEGIKSMQIRPVQMQEQEEEGVSVYQIVSGIDTKLKKGLVNEKRLDAKDTFLSGRVTIWEDFIKEIRWKGHKGEGRVVIGNYRVFKNISAHNAYIQIAYSAGIIAGILYVLLILYILIIIIKDILLKIKTRTLFNFPDMLAILAFINLFLPSFVEGGYMIFTNVQVTLFYFTIHLIVFKDRKLKQLKGKL